MQKKNSEQEHERLKQGGGGVMVGADSGFSFLCLICLFISIFWILKSIKICFQCQQKTF